MRRYKAGEVDVFLNQAELEMAYYGSPSLEVRAGIIHALVRDNYPFSDGRETTFLLNVCKENLRELAKLYRMSTKYTFLRKTAQACIDKLMEVYCGARETFTVVQEDRIDRVAKAVIALMADWSTGRHLELANEPRKRNVDRFLQIYERQSYPKSLDGWFQAKIRSRNLGFDDHPWPEVRNQLVLYLRESVAWELKPPPKDLTLSAFYRGGSISNDVANHLVKGLYRHGELDATVKF